MGVFYYVPLIYEGGPKIEFIYKKTLCIYSYMFKAHSPSKYPLFDVIYLLRVFSLLKMLFELIDFDVFNSFAIFCFTSSTLTKHFPLRTFFIWENKKIVRMTYSPDLTQNKIGWIGRVTNAGHAVFGQKLLNILCSKTRCAHKSPIMKWANTLEES